MDATLDKSLFERAEQAEKKHRAREYVQLVREMTPVLSHAAKVVQERWLELPLPVQDEYVAQRNSIVASIEGFQAQSQRGLLKFVGRSLYSLQLAVYQPELRRFDVAITMFINAVDNAMAWERAVVRSAELELAEHPERALVADGDDVEFDPGDLLRTG